MKKVRVFGHPEIVVSTVVEVEDDASTEEIFKAATASFQGLSQLIGNGGFGDRLIGVNGPGDTIMVDAEPTFDDYTEEL